MLSFRVFPIFSLFLELCRTGLLSVASSFFLCFVLARVIDTPDALELVLFDVLVYAVISVSALPLEVKDADFCIFLRNVILSFRAPFPSFFASFFFLSFLLFINLVQVFVDFVFFEML